ncbi:MAG TPA: hypothetical protein PKZ19_14120 [Zoogloea sp.]|nr:hypothetical protein [Zoogloea sp.]
MSLPIRLALSFPMPLPRAYRQWTQWCTRPGELNTSIEAFDLLIRECGVLLHCGEILYKSREKY